ncbi:MAG: hypothetical protein ACRDKT_10965 [Actinomycetota bacterium]
MKRHPFDPFSFVFGLMFAGLGGLLLNSEIDFADLSGRWLLPLPLLFVGLLFAAFGYSRMRRYREDHPEESFEDPEEEPILE